MATPVFDPRGKLIGVLAVRDLDRADQRHDAEQATIWAQTGESFFVGPDFLMRSDSRFSEADDTLVTTLREPGGRRGAGRHSGDRRHDRLSRHAR